jgi:hypothetical protein
MLTRRLFNWAFKKSQQPSLEIRRAFICEEESKDEDKVVSIIDIKAAIAKQAIPVSDLYSAQDLAANRIVIGLVKEAENRIRSGLESEIVVLQSSKRELQAFKDQREVVELVAASKQLTDKSPKLVAYMKKRFGTGKLVDLSGDLTELQRQEKINAAIAAEIQLVEEMGIDFKELKPLGDDTVAMPHKTPFDEDTERIDYTKPENNPLIPKTEI